MSDLTFFKGIVPLPLAAIAAHAGAALSGDHDAARLFHAVAMLDGAGPGEVAMALATDDLVDRASSRAGACFVTRDQAATLSSETIALIVDDPAAAFASIAALLHPDATRPGSIFQKIGIDPAAIIHADARLETGVSIDPGAIVGPRVEIGSGTTIGANTTIGAGVRIGRGCAIDAQVSISHALLGDRVVIHTGVRIGQGGPSQHDAGGARLGRVIIQNDVEIGANATIARGALEDTVLGEGCRIGAAVGIDPDVRIDRATVRLVG